MILSVLQGYDIAGFRPSRYSVLQYRNKKSTLGWCKYL